MQSYQNPNHIYTHKGWATLRPTCYTDSGSIYNVTSWILNDVNCPASSTQTCTPQVHTIVAVLVGSSSHRSIRSTLFFSGHLLRSMNQPPVETSVPALWVGLAVLAGLLAAGWSLLGEPVLESGCPFRYRDVRELFMWLVGCGWQKAAARDDKSHRQKGLSSDSLTFGKCSRSQMIEWISVYWLHRDETFQ